MPSLTQDIVALPAIIDPLGAVRVFLAIMDGATRSALSLAERSRELTRSV
jgi:hypothetical protein